MVLETRAGLEAGIVGAGHRFTARRLDAQRSVAGWAQEAMGGLAYLDFIRALAHRVDAEWDAVAADLASPGWSAPLVAAGFDPAAPSVTVAEGLVMYLPGEAGAASFLRELAAVAAPGSVLLLVAVTAATAAAARARANGAGLMAAWTCGCDPDPAPLLAACGWRVVGVDTRSDMARRYAAPGREWGFPVRPASPVRAERESLFVVAVRVGGGRAGGGGGGG